MIDYLELFLSAYSDYVNQSQRYDSNLRWLNKFRHKHTLYPYINDLFKKLRKEDAEAQKTAVAAYLKSPETRFNNHSFSIYLLKY